MKMKIIFLVSIVILNYLFSQPSVNWVVTFGSGNYDGGNSGFEEENGDIILAGKSNVNASGMDGLVLKLDSMGQEIWSNTYLSSDGTQHDEIRDIINTPDGGYLGVGMSHQTHGY